MMRWMSECLNEGAGMRHNFFFHRTERTSVDVDVDVGIPSWGFSVKRGSLRLAVLQNVGL